MDTFILENLENIGQSSLKGSGSVLILMTRNPHGYDIKGETIIPMLTAPEAFLLQIQNQSILKSYLS